MSHLYPLASDAAEALNGANHAARSRAEAEALADNSIITSLETEWLTPPDGEVEAMLAKADKGLETGFVQRYEDAGGALVLAVTYWKVTSERRAETRPDTPPEPPPTAPDHTDDLYFREGRTKPRRKKKIDPRQMDFFRGKKDNPHQG